MKNSLIVGGAFSDFGTNVIGLVVPYTFAYCIIRSYLEDVMFHFRNTHLMILTPIWNKCMVSNNVDNTSIYAPIASTAQGLPRLISLTSPDGKVWEQKVDNAGVTTNVAASEVI